mmetsp:Transcript_21480/g.41166  ORF Transcript_21480/g.41166 Transcript_21480/m.41166 type:complete len:281 (-) Transcript_21480:4197-5039(-)
MMWSSPVLLISTSPFSFMVLRGSHMFLTLPCISSKPFVKSPSWIFPIVSDLPTQHSQTSNSSTKSFSLYFIGSMSPVLKTKPPALWYCFSEAQDGLSPVTSSELCTWLFLYATGLPSEVILKLTCQVVGCSSSGERSSAGSRVSANSIVASSDPVNLDANINAVPIAAPFSTGSSFRASTSTTSSWPPPSCRYSVLSTDIWTGLAEYSAIFCACEKLSSRMHWRIVETSRCISVSLPHRTFKLHSYWAAAGLQSGGKGPAGSLNSSLFNMEVTRSWYASL